MIEFAVFAPAMILLFMGMVELGRFATYTIIAEWAARVGAGYGAESLSTAADTNGMKAHAQGDAEFLPDYTVRAQPLCSVNGAMPPTPCVVNPTGPPANTVYYVQVQITATYTPWIDYPGIPNAVNISGTSYQQVYQQ
jgi:Flp pilus assembly protein TadG